MKEDEAYLEIAQRFIDSCELQLNNRIIYQEIVGFKSYHAFESIASAYNSHYGHIVPNSHPGKLNAFVVNCRHDNKMNSIAIATIAMTINSMRNKYLYPELNGTSFKTPKQQISITNAREMVRRIHGIIRQIDRII